MQEVKAAAEKVDGADVIDEINDGFEKLLGGHIIGSLNVSKKACVNLDLISIRSLSVSKSPLT